ncbi:Membrane-associated phospholipid phosphatase [Streptococcus sp. DD10]|nr:Membrane-associated phospholipid phosphatase [Streptococcus sp. DD10]
MFLTLATWLLLNPIGLTSFDSSIQNLIRGDLPELVTVFFSRITILFNTSIVVTWVLVLCFFLIFKNRKRSAIFLATNLATSGILILILKFIFRRPRPAIIHLIEEHGFSFPSGHSLAATLVCGSLIILIGFAVKDRMFKNLLCILFASLIAIILLSRVYLGVHYPSDVVAGFLIGFTILNLGFPTASKWLQKDYE